MTYLSSPKGHEFESRSCHIVFVFLFSLVHTLSPFFCRGYDMVVWRWSACGRERVSQLQGHGSKELFWYCVAKCERLIS